MCRERRNGIPSDLVRRFAQVGELGAEFDDFGGDDEEAVGLGAVVGEVVLVVVFGGEELGGGGEFGDNGVGEDLGGGQLVNGGLGGGALVFGVVEDGGAVLGAVVGTLAVEGGGIVDGEEDVEELGVGDEGGVKDDADGFGVAGHAGADVLVGGVGEVAANVAGFDGNDAFEVEEDGFETPETASGEGGGFGGGGRVDH